ncbi:MAG: flagellar hook-associated protein 3 FlgL [Alphaproteobacteria bacterium]|jgi:flagellin-like hook-associated protein FlgL|nr:flagellar hook-associated protein 3 FlgL [Alphaproteobacteria bacterium]
MSISGIGSRSALGVQSLVDMRAQLDDLQRQLGTGKRASTYAGVGLERGFVVGLRSHVAALSSFDDAGTQVGVRVNLAQSVLGRIGDIGHAVKATAFQQSNIDSSGSTTGQTVAYSELGEILGLLNTQSGDRYLFSGRATDQPAVESVDHIMNGDGARAGFKQIVAERKQADLGANGLGRLVVSAPTATAVSLAEDSVSPFGFKLSGVNSTLSNATVTGPAGAPAALSVNLTGLPNAGGTLQVRFNLPDGTTESITLTATSSPTPGANEFAIGATPAATAANLQAKLTATLGKLADTSLTAASAVTAGKDFFGDPPQRVSGPPFNSATALVTGTPSNTVSWYTGENGSDPARATATARVDSAISVSYGVRANEQGIRWTIQNIAALAVVTFPPGDPNATARNGALNRRVGTNLDTPAGIQQVKDIQAELAGVQSTIATATDRHQQTKSTLADLLEQIEGVPVEQVAAQILALQTRLQASLQTTSMLYKISLVNYI